MCPTLIGSVMKVMLLLNYSSPRPTFQGMVIVFYSYATSSIIIIIIIRHYHFPKLMYWIGRSRLRDNGVVHEVRRRCMITRWSRGRKQEKFCRGASAGFASPGRKRKRERPHCIVRSVSKSRLQRF